MQFIIYLLIINAVSSVICDVHQLIYLQKSLHRLPPPGHTDSKLPKYKWNTIKQRVDNFDPINSNTWEMRYISNMDYYVKHGPIFVMIGGEWGISSGYVESGQMFEAAKKHSGAMFYTEHRYYGNSHPTSDHSTSNLKYLSADQALEDLAHFIDYQRKQLESDTVIVFGGSYAANLATWSRLKYPHLIQGAIASSGPVRAKSDFKEYMEVVNDAMSFVDKECVEIINTATKDLETLYQTSEGINEAENILETCPKLTIDNDLGKSLIFQTIAYRFAGIVQYAKKNDIANTCNRLKNQVGTPLEKLVRFIFGSMCANTNYDSYVSYYKNEQISGDAGRQWFYQTCTEYGYFQSSDSEHQPFGSSFPVEFSLKLCRDVFGERFSKQMHEDAVKRTNIVYGSDHPDVTKVIFTNGNVDPWHALSVLQDLNAETPAIFVNGSSHCADLSSINSSDNEEMIAAKNRVQSIIDEWLK